MTQTLVALEPSHPSSMSDCRSSLLFYSRWFSQERFGFPYQRKRSCHSLMSKLAIQNTQAPTEWRCKYFPQNVPFKILYLSREKASTTSFKVFLLLLSRCAPLFAYYPSSSSLLPSRAVSDMCRHTLPFSSEIWLTSCDLSKSSLHHNLSC